jgi:small subunit ribosomal protein S17
MSKKQLKGIIISDKMNKTVVVNVGRIKKDPKYKRRYTLYKKYKAHDEMEEFKVGDNVIIEECKPLSKDKRWKVIKKIKGNKKEEKIEEVKEEEKKEVKEVKEEEEKEVKEEIKEELEVEVEEGEVTEVKIEK